MLFLVNSVPSVLFRSGLTRTKFKHLRCQLEIGQLCTQELQLIARLSISIFTTRAHASVLPAPKQPSCSLETKAMSRWCW